MKLVISSIRRQVTDPPDPGNPGRPGRCFAGLLIPGRKMPLTRRKEKGLLYLFRGKPLAVEALPAWLRERERKENENRKKHWEKIHCKNLFFLC